MQEVLPKVSTPSKFLTNTYFYYNLLAVIAKETVTQPKSPSGTLATNIPIPNVMQSPQL